MTCTSPSSFQIWIPMDLKHLAGFLKWDAIHSKGMLNDFQILLRRGESLVEWAEMNLEDGVDGLMAKNHTGRTLELDSIRQDLWALFKALSHSNGAESHLNHTLLDRYTHLLAVLEPPFENLEKLEAVSKYLESIGQSVKREPYDIAWIRSGIKASPMSCVSFALISGHSACIRSILRALISTQSFFGVSALIHRLMSGAVSVDTSTAESCFWALGEMRDLNLGILLYFFFRRKGLRLSVESYKHLLYLLGTRRDIFGESPRRCQGHRRGKGSPTMTFSDVSFGVHPPWRRWQSLQYQIRTNGHVVSKSTHQRFLGLMPRDRKDGPRYSQSRFSTLDIATRIFKESLIIHPNSQDLYARMIRVAITHKKSELIDALLSEMSARSIDPPPALIFSMIRYYLKQGNIEKGSFLFRYARDDHEKDVRLWEAFIYGCMWLRRWGSLMRAVEQMRGAGLHPSDALYDRMMQKLMFSLPKLYRLRELQLEDGRQLSEETEVAVATLLGEAKTSQEERASREGLCQNSYTLLM
ncbi:hypothetical protein HDU67_000857 [Dinochytrium kinnereticum]|nr:hypothetical protein HDU67_000857 [Dinochytrium kinnereticum]